MGVIVAYVLVTYAFFAPAVAYAGRPLGIGATHVFRVVGRQMVGALSSAAVGFLLRHTLLADIPRTTRVASLTLAYIGMYFVLVVGLFNVRTPLRFTASLLLDFLPSRFGPTAKLGYLRGPGNG